MWCCNPLLLVQMGHMDNEITNDQIQPNAKEYYDCTDNHSEPHFIDFSLFNALFPDIELETRLDGISLVTN